MLGRLARLHSRAPFAAVAAAAQTDLGSAIRSISGSAQQDGHSAQWGVWATAIGLGIAATGALTNRAIAAQPADAGGSVTVTLASGAKVEVLTPKPGEQWEVRLGPTPAPTHGKPPQAPELAGPFQVPPPPYALDALEPHMSRATLEYHWGKHHRTYCENLNKQVAGTELAGLSLEEVVKRTWNKGKPTPEFNNAAQVWNHTFFWQSMKPGGGGKPQGPLADAIVRDFGSFDELKAQFKAMGQTQFGSGWAWLVTDSHGRLRVMKTGNAVVPTVSGWTCLLTCDVWEHAYYLDFQNRRPDYLTTFLDHLVDWGAAGERYSRVLAAAA